MQIVSNTRFICSLFNQLPKDTTILSISNLFCRIFNGMDAFVRGGGWLREAQFRFKYQGGMERADDKSVISVLFFCFF